MAELSEGVKVSGAADTDLAWASAIVRSFEPYSFVRFHREELPALVERRGHLVVADLVGVPPLGFRCNGTVFTWLATERGVDIAEGDARRRDAGGPVRRDVLRVPSRAADRARRGKHRPGASGPRRATGWQRWEPAIKVAVLGPEIYGPTVWQTLVDRAGDPLDLRRRSRSMTTSTRCGTSSTPPATCT